MKAEMLYNVKKNSYGLFIGIPNPQN